MSGASNVEAAAPPAGGVATKKTRKHKPKQLTAKSHETALGRYATFLQGLARREGDPGFPNFFAVSDFVRKLSGYAADLTSLGSAKEQKREADGKARAGRTRGNAVLDQGSAALVAFYGPSAAVLAEFGIKPKRPRSLRHRKATHRSGGGTGGGSTPAATAGASGGASS